MRRTYPNNKLQSGSVFIIETKDYESDVVVVTLKNSTIGFLFVIAFILVDSLSLWSISHQISAMEDVFNTQKMMFM